MPRSAALFIFTTVLSTAACDIAAPGGAAPSDNQPDRPQPPGPDDPNLDPAAQYAAQCASCHGVRAEGAQGPALDRWRADRAAMIAAIDERMPTDSPEKCKGSCASSLADYILNNLQRPAVPVCDESLLPPRQLRLLTRWEYINVVKDLLGAPSAARSCQSHSDCALRSESCEMGSCQPDRCGVHTFVFEPGSRTVSSVVVAGSFNDWSPQGMALSREGALWLLKAELGPGRHSYKFVINGEQWETDPSSPMFEPDGFGGQNSVVELDCSGSSPGQPNPPGLDLQALTEGFPAQTRPSGYLFDNSASAGLVTATLFDEQLAAAIEIAQVIALPDCSTAQDCAARFFEDFGLRALRRPLTAEEQARYGAMISGAPNVQDGLRAAARAMLVSPAFLYRAELGQPEGEGLYKLSDYELASQLSFFLWASAPDLALLSAAAAGQLSEPAQLAEQARRLLEDPRSRRTMERFAAQWLGAERILTVDKHPDRFGALDAQLRQSMLEETQRFFSHAVFEAGFEALFLADYTFADERLASFYGLSSQGRVELGSERVGLLTQGALLGAFAYSDQTSPVHRGLFVRERLLCQPLGVPPPGAGGIPEVESGATGRERFSQHSSDPTCAACHRLIDDVGFGFEQFDAIGRYRDSEAGRPIDHSGIIRDLEGPGSQTEQAFSTPRELAELLAGSESAKRCFSTQLYRYARGALEADGDGCSLLQLQQQLLQSDDLSALLVAVTQTPAFRYRR